MPNYYGSFPSIYAQRLSDHKLFCVIQMFFRYEARSIEQTVIEKIDLHSYY